MGRRKRWDKELSSCGTRCSRTAYMHFRGSMKRQQVKYRRLACHSINGIDYDDEGRNEHTLVGTWGHCGQSDVHLMTRLDGL